MRSPWGAFVNRPEIAPYFAGALRACGDGARRGPKVFVSTKMIASVDCGRMVTPTGRRDLEQLLPNKFAFANAGGASEKPSAGMVVNWLRASSLDMFS